MTPKEAFRELCYKYALLGDGCHGGMVSGLGYLEGCFQGCLGDRLCSSWCT